MPKLLILDTETTGLKIKDELIELAMSLIEVDRDGNYLEELASYEGRREPSVPITRGALAAHGIQLIDLLGKQLDFPRVQGLIDAADICIAHNAPFDARMLRPLFPKVDQKPWRCTFNQWPWQIGSRRRLQDAAALLGIRTHQLHSALGDVRTLRDCLFAAANLYSRILLSAGDYKLGEGRTFFARDSGKALTPEVQKACEQLKQMISRLMVDSHLGDEEINILNGWLVEHPEVGAIWPITEINEKLNQILSDGIVSEIERDGLEAMLNAVSHQSFQTVVEAARNKALNFDEPETLTFEGSVFCLTGNFVRGGKESCELEIVKRGGKISNAVSKKLDYLIVGGLGSPQYKHGNFGTKVEKAIELRAANEKVQVIHEITWSHFLLN